jgi:electron transfer flavoprotein alpha subunit
VVAEHDGTKISPATQHCITAAKQIIAKAKQQDANSSIDVLVVAAPASGDALAKAAASAADVKQVFLASDAKYEHPVAEVIASAIQAQHNANKYTHILAGATTFGKNALPRVGATLDVQPIADILQVKDDSTFVRPIYAGNALQTVESQDPVKLITVRTTAFAAAPTTGGNGTVAAAAAGEAESALASYESSELAKSERPELTSARVVISGGRGLQNGDNFKLLYELADKIGNGRDAAVGASRAAVDAGFVPNDLQVGQTGKIVAPELYVAVGISGAIQHLAGMKDSKVIVAINKDEEAPIFHVADYGLVGDLFQVVPELTKAISK